MFSEYETPEEFFGPGYELGSNKISLPTASGSLVNVGAFTVDDATDVLTFGSDHHLLVGDRVQVSSTTTLPAGLSPATDYYVRTRPSATTITLGATFAATADVDITDAGSGTHSLEVEPLLKEVTDAEANASTGDSRKVVFGLLEVMARRLNAIPSESRPTKLSATRSTYEDGSTGEFVKTYQFTVRTAAAGFEVSDE